MQELRGTRRLVVLELETETSSAGSASKAGACCHCSQTRVLGLWCEGRGQGSGSRGDYRPGRGHFKWGGYRGDVQSTVRCNRRGCLAQRVREGVLDGGKGRVGKHGVSERPEAGMSISCEEARAGSAEGGGTAHGELSPRGRRGQTTPGLPCSPGEHSASPWGEWAPLWSWE